MKAFSLSISTMAFLLAAAAVLTPAPCSAGESAAEQKNYAVLVYGGKISAEHWYQSFGPSTEFLDSEIAVLALNHTIHRAADRSYSYEIEAQIGQHSGLQDHTEFNLLGAYRWHRLPWSKTLNSSVSFGLGVSHATEVPVVEVTLLKGTSERTLAYWHLELTLGPHDSDWQAMLRLHHRSTAFGLFGKDGGSNALTLGVRYAFD